MRKTGLQFLACFAFLTGILAAQTPTFTGIVNPASNLPPGVPNYGIAQGSIFVIYGSNLGPAALVQAASATLPTTAGLAGTSVSIAQNGGFPVIAPMIYASAGQVAAVMPSNTPLGSDTVTLTYNGKTGSFPVQVVQTNFGISTVQSTGYGPAVVTFPDYSLVTNTKSAKPGDTLILWGTGLGPIAGRDDIGAAGGNLPVPIQVFVGGIPANIQYQGRTPTVVGLDQINFVVPQGITPGCSVSIVVQTNGATSSTVSNAPTMAIAPNGGTCSDTNQNFPADVLASVSGKTSVKALALQLEQDTIYNTQNGSPQVTVSANAQFLSFSKAQLAAQISSLNNGLTLNSCVVEVVSSSAGGVKPPDATGLNVGNLITMVPATGNAIALTAQSTGLYTGSVGSLSTGNFQFSNGTGGADVGALTFAFPVPQPVSWTNRTQIAGGGAIDRTKPLSVTWSGGDTNGYVGIIGQAQTAGSNPYTVQFGCAAPSTAGSFNIPSSILLAMPPGSNASASLEVDTLSYPSGRFSAPGFDVTLDLAQFVFRTPVVFK